MKKTGFPVLFSLLILVISVSLAVNAVKDLGLGGVVREMAAGFQKADVADWETRVNEDLDRDHLFINLFGAIQRGMGRRFVEDSAGYPVARLSNGQLTFAGVTENVDQTENAENLVKLQEALAPYGIPVMTVIEPSKLSNPAAAMPEGVADYGNAMADSLLKLLEGRADTLDLRPAFLQADPDNSWFFRTDHHWRPEGALFACGALMEKLSASYGFAVDRQALDPDSYDRETYRDIFLGSQGKRVGLYYAGVDDFTVLTPKFDTDLLYTYDGARQPRQGPFAQSVCFPEELEKGYFDGNPYVYYSGGDWGWSDIVNRNNPDGPTVVLIRDSYSCALTPFLSLQFGRLHTIDLRAYSGDLIGELAGMHPDCVLVIYCASTVKDPDMFCFFDRAEDAK